MERLQVYSKEAYSCLTSHYSLWTARSAVTVASINSSILSSWWFRPNKTLNEPDWMSEATHSNSKETFPLLICFQFHPSFCCFGIWVAKACQVVMLCIKVRTLSCCIVFAAMWPIPMQCDLLRICWACVPACTLLKSTWCSARADI